MVEGFSVGTVVGNMVGGITGALDGLKLVVGCIDIDGIDDG